MAKEDKPIKENKEEENKKETNNIDDLEISGKEEREAGQNYAFNQSKIVMINNLLKNIKDSAEKVQDLLSTTTGVQGEERITIGQMNSDYPLDKTGGEEAENGRIVEGVFDGENMIGPDGKQYSVPSNYASKSKLVEGDILKLTITPNGTFVYKQIGPIDRIRVVGKLSEETSGNFIVKAEKKKWRVLTASVTYFKGQDGDEVVILVPKVGESKWAAVENIVKRS